MNFAIERRVTTAVAGFSRPGGAKNFFSGSNG
jgi:hypothetical protein